MTQPGSPPNSGQPPPVQGVTGGPPVFGGQISNDPQNGNIVIAPNPGNVLQVRKGNVPQAIQVYEYFNTNTDYSRLALNTQTGGPFQLAVETAPSGLIRGLSILSNSDLVFNLNGANRWRMVGATGNFEPIGGTGVIGSTTNPVSSVYLTSIFSPPGTPIAFGIGSTIRWNISQTVGHFQPNVTNITDIGSLTLAVRQGFFQSGVVIGNSTTITGGGTIRSGSTVPNNAVGVDGDYYFRTDTPSVANQRIYVRSAGVYVGIV